MKIDTLITFAADCITLTREDAEHLLKQCGSKEGLTIRKLRNFVDLHEGSLMHIDRLQAKEYLRSLVS